MAHQDSSSPVTREQLYEEVWTVPVQTLAPRFGLSARGLAKLCAREDIPVPPRGYWAKIRAGRRVRRPRLPPARDRPNRQLNSFPLVKSAAAVSPPSDEPLFSRDLEALLVSVHAAPSLVVRMDLRGQHRAIRSIADESKQWRARLQQDSFYDPPWHDARSAPGLSVELERRTLLLLDALARRLDSLGVALQPAPHRGAALKGTLMGVDFTVYAYEPVRRVKFNPPEKDPWHYKWEYKHSGRLELGVVAGYGPDRVWRGDADRLGQRLDEVVPALVLAVDRQLRVIADNERRRREDEERARLRAAAEAARQAELCRRKQLLDESALWRRVVHARDYVAAAEAALATAGTTADSVAEQADWIEWARDTLDRMDPVLGRRRAAETVHDGDAPT